MKQVLHSRILRWGTLSIATAALAAATLSAQYTQLWDFDEDAEGWEPIAHDDGNPSFMWLPSSLTEGYPTGGDSAESGVTGANAYSYERSDSFEPRPGGTLLISPAHHSGGAWVAQVAIPSDNPHYAAIMDARSASPEMGIRFDFSFYTDLLAGNPTGDTNRWYQIYASFRGANEPGEGVYHNNKRDSTNMVSIGGSEDSLTTDEHYTAIYPLSAFTDVSASGDALTFAIGVNKEPGLWPASPYYVAFDNFRLVAVDADPLDEGGEGPGTDPGPITEPPAATWNGIDVQDGWVFTDEAFLGWLWVGEAGDQDWVYAYSLNTYLYLPAENVGAEGTWAYVMDFEALTLDATLAPWLTTPALNTWLYVPDYSAETAAGWAFVWDYGAE